MADPVAGYTWALNDATSGTLSSPGLFQANSVVGGPYQVIATAGGFSTAATITVRGIAPTNQRRSPLYRQPLAAFDAARWASDPAYRTSYLGVLVPERVWETAPPGGTAPALSLTGSARQRGMIGSVVQVAITAVAGMPVSICVDRPEVALVNQQAVWTGVCGADGVVQVPVTITGDGLARMVVGSPAGIGNIHVLVEGVKP